MYTYVVVWYFRYVCIFEREALPAGPFAGGAATARSWRWTRLCSGIRARGGRTASDSRIVIMEMTVIVSIVAESEQINPNSGILITRKSKHQGDRSDTDTEFQLGGRGLTLRETGGRA